jgi:hypothetical protein
MVPEMGLDRLVGTWDVEALLDGRRVGGGTTTFAWTEDGAFLVERVEGEPPGPEVPREWIDNLPFPVVSLIGRDDARDELTMLYADARGVRRVYSMAFDGDTWRRWRDAPGFNQRFTGTFDEAGTTITGYWEMSKDGVTWSKDFDLIYRKR